MPEFTFTYYVQLAGVEAADHAEMRRKVVFSATVDGEPWPVLRQEWLRTSTRKDARTVIMWEVGSPDEGEEVGSFDDTDSAGRDTPDTLK
jgi:hypothetical protein